MKQTALILLVSLVGVLLAPNAVARDRQHEQCSFQGTNNQYDYYFKRAVRRHWPGPLSESWCTFKAQCIVESGQKLNPQAASHAGAVGTCQILRSTFEEVARKNDLRGVDRRSARDSIEVGAAYMARLMSVWYERRTLENRYMLGAASYNAGIGNIIRAQVKSGNERDWAQISPHLHKVTGNHSKETIDYINRIRNTTYKLKGVSLL